MRHWKSTAVSALFVIGMGAGCPPEPGDDNDLLDRDGDGQRSRATGGTDCDDADPTVYLGAEERCGNLQDDDCDNLVDEDGVGAQPFYADTDRDGYGAPNTVTYMCTIADGFADNDFDCNDQDADWNPSANDDECDTLDQNCDDVPDDEAEQFEWWPDEDEDGYGDRTKNPTLNCATELAYHARVGGDCEDLNPFVSPAAKEACNGRDDNCDDDIDGPVIGDGLECPAESCEEIHTRQESARNDDFWIRDQRNGGTPIQVECATVPGAGNGWMRLTMPWVEEDDQATFATGGALGATAKWVTRNGERVPLLDSVHQCASPMRWASFQVNTPYPFQDIVGTWILFADDAGRSTVRWSGADNVEREFGGGLRKNEDCGNGAVLFGPGLAKLKRGTDWGSPWAREDRSLCRDVRSHLCRQWSDRSVYTEPEPTSRIRWEIHGTTSNANPSATLRDVDLYIR